MEIRAAVDRLRRGKKQNTLWIASPTNTIRPLCQLSRTPSSNGTNPALVREFHSSPKSTVAVMGMSINRAAVSWTSVSVYLTLVGQRVSRSVWIKTAQYMPCGCVEIKYESPLLWHIFTSPWPKSAMGGLAPKRHLYVTEKANYAFNTVSTLQLQRHLQDFSVALIVPGFSVLACCHMNCRQVLCTPSAPTRISPGSTQPSAVKT